MRTLAIIPARGGSSRVPRKNIADICGKPALSYPVRTCLDSGLFDEVIVSTDDEEIGTIAEQAGARCLMRPADLSDGHARVRDVVRYVLRQIETLDGKLPDAGCTVYPTAVLLQPHHLREAMAVLQTRADVDFVMAVTAMHPHAYKAVRHEGPWLRPVFEDKIDLKGQQFPDYFAPCGSFHWFRTGAMLTDTAFWAQRRVGFVLERQAGIDIDEPEDLELVRAIMQARQARAADKPD